MAINSSDSKYEDLLEILRRTFSLLDVALYGEVVHLMYDTKFMMENLPAKPPTNS